MRNAIAVFGALVMGAFAPIPAFSLPIFSADANLGSNGGQDDRTANTPVSATNTFHSGFEGLNFYSATAFASAEPGGLRTSAQSTIFLNPLVNLGFGPLLIVSDGTASFRLDDVVVSGSGSSVLGSLNLELDGGLNTSSFAQLGSGMFDETQANASVALNLCIISCVSGTRFSGSVTTGSISDVDTQSSSDQGPFESELLTGFTDGVAQGAPFGIVTPALQLPVGTPFSIFLQLRSHTEARSRNTIVGSARQADAAALFDHTLSFPVTGPVFNLPDGFTVQSVSGLIAGNAWQGGPSDPEPIPVPEPGTLWLLASSLLALICFAPRRTLLENLRA